MENAIRQQLKSRRLLLLALVSAILILIFATIFFLSLNKQKETEELRVELPTKNSPSVSPRPTLAVLNKSFDGVRYKVSYPSNWSFNSLPVVRGGTLTQFSENIKNHEAFPRVDIQATPISSSSATIEKLVSNLSLLKLPQDEVIFHGQKAVRLTGTLPFDFRTQTGVTKKVNKTFLFIELSGTRYIIDYAYYEDESRESSLNLINRILSTYQFQ